MDSIYNPAGGFPILSLITYLPLVGALGLLFFPKSATRPMKIFANLVLFADLLLSIPLYFAFNAQSADFQFVERFEWIRSLGVQYSFGIDGISLWLFLLTTFLGSIAALSSWHAIHEREKEYYVFLLLLQVGMLGVFCSLDFVLFYVFWEVMLVPMYFLIGVWGGPRRLYAAIKFFLYTLFGSVLMLLGILTVYFFHTAHHAEELASSIVPHAAQTFDIPALTQFMQQIPLPSLVAGQPGWLAALFGLQGLVFLGFFVAFAIKVPMFPFHTWLPDAHVEAPTAGSVILAGVLLKMGTYGFMRFSLPMFPEATLHFQSLILALAVIGIVYGALVAMKQDDMKKLVAYSSVSHLGFVVLGLFMLNPNGITGGMLQMINHGLSTGALFLLVGVIYERRHTRLIAEFGGLSKVMPVYAIVFLIITLSSIGLPVLNGFIGEFLILAGAMNVHWTWAAYAGTGIVLGAAYMLWLYQRVMFNALDKPANQGLMDLTRREIACFAPIVVFCFWIGIYPKPFIDPMMPAITRVVEKVGPPAYAQAGTRRAEERIAEAVKKADEQKLKRLGAGEAEGHGAEHHE